MTTPPPFADIAFAPAAVDVTQHNDGSLILRSPQPLQPFERHLGEMLRNQASTRPKALFLAERNGSNWRTITYGEALATAESLAEDLLLRGLGPDHPVMVLSGNSLNHALLMLSCFLSGIPIVPVSPAYSLMSRDFAKVHHIVKLVKPALIYVDDTAPFGPVLESLAPSDAALVAGTGASNGPPAELFTDLLATRPGAALRRAEAELTADSIAKYLFTSGSTGLPKGVINTHRMLCSNQTMIEQCWPFLREQAPLLVDWLPWNHTFGGNHNFNMTLKQGGMLYIDAGKPAPKLIKETVRNLKEIAPTLYFNVPAGYAQLLPHLECDAELRRNFFRRLRLIFFAGAALPQDLWERLESLSIMETGQRVPMTSAWGSTETAPMATSAHFYLDRAGVIGLPPPGVAIKLVPSDDKLELRVKGANVTPGYLGPTELTTTAFDHEGFYCIGDAGCLLDPNDPAKGIVFDGRVAEDFKLATGIWVHVGNIRVQVLAAAAPILQDAVVTGPDRNTLGLLAWPNLNACKALLGDTAETLDAAAICRHPAILERLQTGLQAHNAAHPGSSTRIERVLLMTEPADIDANEITDKGYINQRAVLSRRSERVAQLYADSATENIIKIEN